MNTKRWFRSSREGLVIVSIIILILSALTFIGTKSVRADSAVNVWWPTNNATIQGTVPFKVMVQGLSVSDYKMYWQVDGGGLVEMQDNSADYPHKEAQVDVSGWNWQSSGQYKINFVAKKSDGSIVGQAGEVINVKSNTSAPVVVVPAPTPAPVSTPTQTAPAPVAPVVPVVQTQPTQPVVNTASSQTAGTVTGYVNGATTAKVDIWWPANGATLSGSVPFKALANGLALNQYKMYWQVDGGGLVEMQDNSADYPHKEAQVDVSGWKWKGSGPYAINFVAKDLAGNVIGQTGSQINIANGLPAQPAQNPVSVIPAQAGIQTANSGNVSTQPVAANSPTTPLPPPLIPLLGQEGSQYPQAGGEPYKLSGATLFVNPDTQAEARAKAYESWGDSYNANLLNKIASQPSSAWLGDWNLNVKSDVNAYVTKAVSAGAMPVLVAYDIPHRDAGSYSSGGASSDSAYKSWIDSFAQGIGNRKAVVILEPDALAQLDLLSQNDQAVRLSLLNYAVNALKTNPNTVVYIDAGNSAWKSAGEMATRLNQAGIAKADGFSLNVSNFEWTDNNVAYGNAISALVGNKHFVIDTSRNGSGPVAGVWCNPWGRSLGPKPTTSTGKQNVDAFLWIKAPGESDGNANGGPSAGVFWDAYAINLAQNANW